MKEELYRGGDRKVHGVAMLHLVPFSRNAKIKIAWVSQTQLELCWVNNPNSIM
jgi:hypothetical protein